MNVLTINKNLIAKNLRNLILNKYEKINEENYVRKHTGSENTMFTFTNEKNGINPEAEKMNTELLKLQRKLRRVGDPSPEKKILPKQGIKKPVEYRYDLSKFKCKSARRASISTLDPGYIHMRPPEPEYMPIQTTLIEPYTL